MSSANSTLSQTSLAVQRNRVSDRLLTIPAINRSAPLSRTDRQSRGLSNIAVTVSPLAMSDLGSRTRLMGSRGASRTLPSTGGIRSIWGYIDVGPWASRLTENESFVHYCT